MRRRRQHHLIAWAVLWAVVGALFALGTDARATDFYFYIANPSGLPFETGTLTATASGGAGITFCNSVTGWSMPDASPQILGTTGACGTNILKVSVDVNWGGPGPYCSTVTIMGTAAHSHFSGSGTVCGDYGPSFPGTTNTMPYPINVLNGPAACSDGVTVTAHWDGGAPHAAGAVVNIVVGGFLAQVQCDANGCNGGTFPAAQLNTTGSAPYNVGGGVDPGSWAICGVSGSRYQTTVTNKSAWPSSVACGGTVDIALDAHCAQTTPTPSPSASVAPSPSTTPVITPEPSPSSTPLQYETPPPNAPGTGVTNGGTTMSGITNQDIYNDVKQALDDAGNRDTEYIVPNGGFGFGSDPSGENGSAGNGLQSAVNRFTNDLSGSGDGLMQKVDAIDSLTLPTSIGDKSSWAVTLPVLGNLTIDLSTFDGPVWAFRSLCLAILVVGAWFAMIKIIRSGVA